MRGVYLTADQVDAILAQRAQGRSQRAIAVELRLGRGTIGNVLADPQAYLERAARYAAKRGPKPLKPERVKQRCRGCGGTVKLAAGEACPKCAADAHKGGR